MITHKYVFVAAIFSICGPFAVADADNSSPRDLFGAWSSGCDAWGVPATCQATWSEGLHPSHLVQSYTITRQSDHAQIFAGRGLYRIVDGDVDGTWEDAQGSIHQLSGTFEDGTLNIIWGSAKTEIGRSEYVLSDHTLTVSDSVLTEQGWREFMTIAYARDRLD